MPNRSEVVIALRKQLREVRATADQLHKAVRILESLGRPGARTTRTISAAGRRRIAVAQRKRWAKLRLAKKH